MTEAGNATYTDILDLLAFTSYSLNIEARSGGGTVVSNSTVVQTSEAGKPLRHSLLLAISILVISSFLYAALYGVATLRLSTQW